MELTPTGSDAFYDAASKVKVFFLGISWKPALGRFFQSEHLHVFFRYLTISLDKTHRNQVIFDSYDAIQVSLEKLWVGRLKREKGAQSLHKFL